MRILLAHNRYGQRGGEDVEFEAERDLLRARGHEVSEYLRDNAELEELNRGRQAAETIWSRRTARDLSEIISAARPEVVHFHNTFLRISPSAYHVCRGAGVPVVQTIQNYRLICPAATLYRAHQVCESCVGKRLAYPAILHACYRGSRAQSAVVASMLAIHRTLGTWRGQIDLYLAVSEFSRQKLIEGGLPAERILVKPNFVAPDPGERTTTGEHALFVGRLSPEKGVDLMLEAWSRVPLARLVVAGDGPERGRLEAIAATAAPGRVQFFGHCNRERTLGLMKGSAFLVMASRWYEGLPLTMLEAFACGVPILAPRLGSMTELVEHGATGLLFEPGSADDLANQVAWAYEHTDSMKRMGNEARRRYLERFTADRNYPQLMAAYERVQTRPG